MKCTLLPLAAVLATQAAADVPAVLSAIAAIADKNQQLDTLIPQTTLGLFGVASVLDVDVALVELVEALDHGIDVVTSGPAFGDDGSVQVATALVNLTPGVNKTLSDLNVQQPILYNYRSLVLASLYGSRERTNTFGQAVLAKGNSNLKTAGPIVINQINGWYNTSIGLFLPPF